MGSRFEKFSERARRVLSLAQEEAQRFNHTSEPSTFCWAWSARPKVSPPGCSLACPST